MHQRNRNLMSRENLLFENMLTLEESSILQEMNTPYRIQQFLDSTLYVGGNENRSPIEVLRQRKAHCLDGGLFAATLLQRIGYLPLILDMQPDPGEDDDHVLALFQEFDCWGAVAKSNYVGLRYREPVYRTIRELVVSYFNDYFNVARKKSLRKYTEVINLSEFDEQHWMTEASGVDWVEEYLKKADTILLITLEQAAYLSPLDERSYKAGSLGVNPDGVYKPQ